MDEDDDFDNQSTVSNSSMAGARRHGYYARSRAQFGPLEIDTSTPATRRNSATSNDGLMKEEQYPTNEDGHFFTRRRKRHLKHARLDGDGENMDSGYKKKNFNDKNHKA